MIEEIGEEGWENFKKTLKFGDVIENGNPSERSLRRFGIIVGARDHSINCTNGVGVFWDLPFSAYSKIEFRGNVLNDNYEKLINNI